MISTSGFQAGSFSASELTNVQLVTWEQFQEAFEATWFDTYLLPRVADRLDPLLTYAEPLLPKWFDSLSEADKEAYFALKEKYDEFGWLAMLFTPYAGSQDSANGQSCRLPTESETREWCRKRYQTRFSMRMALGSYWMP